MPSYVLSVIIATIFAVQTPSSAASAPSPGKAKPVPVTMSGCVTEEAGTPNWYAFADAVTGVKYRVSGVSLRKFSGKRVEIVGAPPAHGLTIRGGLMPSPNVAAQAGALDPVKAADAQMPGGSATGTGNVELPDLRVTRARQLTGSCR